MNNYSYDAINYGIRYSSVVLNIAFFENKSEDKIFEQFRKVFPGIGIRNWKESAEENQRFVVFGKEFYLESLSGACVENDLVQALQMIRRFTKCGSVDFEVNGEKIGYEFDDLTGRWTAYVFENGEKIQKKGCLGSLFYFLVFLFILSFSLFVSSSQVCFRFLRRF